MGKAKAGQHISHQFNIELEEIRNRVLEMGGLVEQQINNAIKSLVEGNIELANTVIQRDMKVNAAEVAIDEECSQDTGTPPTGCIGFTFSGRGN